MALKGTLKDFGIAEILQLIGQQAKSGVLHLRSKGEEVHIVMSDGCLVSAEHAGRKARERLGTLLVRAELITKEQLEAALEAQRRTLRRLGDILVEMQLVTKPDLREMTALQTTETVYQLFHWKSGTYEFAPGAVEFDASTVTPLRAESILMEGFRQVDEWPLVRKKITSTAMTFERLRDLAPEGGDESRGDEVDAAFEEVGDAKADAGPGASERRVFALAEPERTVGKIIDLSRLGEFETCKALLNLVNAGHLRAIPPPKRSAASEVGAYARDWQQRVRQGAARLAATLAIAATLAGVAYTVSERGLAWTDPAGDRGFHDNGAQRFLARSQMARLAGALEVYRLERGRYPNRLDELVDAGLVAGRDLEYPWKEHYYYRRRGAARFVLLPPIE